jgi:hypothetical protein
VWQPLSNAYRLLLGEDLAGNIGPYSGFASLTCILESLKVSQCSVFPILYAAISVTMNDSAGVLI